MEVTNLYKPDKLVSDLLSWINVLLERIKYVQVGVFNL